MPPIEVRTVYGTRMFRFHITRDPDDGGLLSIWQNYTLVDRILARPEGLCKHSRYHGLANVCRVLLNGNEFLFVN